MLYEAPPFYMINGVSIMPDHADPLQFYYMPLAPRFVTRKDGALEVPQLLVIKYRSATRAGGFADFDVHLGMSEQELEAMRAQLQALAGLDALPKLSPVPVVDGSVKLMLFGRMSGEEADDDDAPPTDPGFVRAMHHAAKPGLYGDNRAAFSVELDERGITILDAAMRGEMAPIGVVYGLDYLALRPAYHVKLKIDWDRVQDIMDTQYGHEGLFTSIQIQDMVEKLEDERVIVFEADTFVPEDEGGSITERRDAAVARARHDHRHVLRKLDRPAAPGARRLGQGGQRDQVVLAAASVAVWRVLVQEDALLAHRSTSTFPSAPPSSGRSIRRATCRGCSAHSARGSTRPGWSSPSTPTTRGSSGGGCASFRAPTSIATPYAR